MAPVAEHLPSKHKALSSSPSTAKEKNQLLDLTIRGNFDIKQTSSAHTEVIVISVSKYLLGMFIGNKILLAKRICTPSSVTQRC
jgi:hypothetical protein